MRARAPLALPDEVSEVQRPIEGRDVIAAASDRI
jgi:hypothetical protein